MTVSGPSDSGVTQFQCLRTDNPLTVSLTTRAQNAEEFGEGLGCAMSIG